MHHDSQPFVYFFLLHSIARVRAPSDLPQIDKNQETNCCKWNHKKDRNRKFVEQVAVIIKANYSIESLLAPSDISQGRTRTHPEPNTYLAWNLPTNEEDRIYRWTREVGGPSSSSYSCGARRCGRQHFSVTLMSRTAESPWPVLL